MREFRREPIVTWCQPPDPRTADLIVIDGQVVNEDDAATREYAVSQINGTARTGVRTPLPSQGWRSESPRSGTVVAQIPVEYDDPAVMPSVAVLLPDLASPTIDRATEQIVLTAELAGYHVTPGAVQDALRYRPPPIGLISRFIHWILSLFGKGGKE